MKPRIAISMRATQAPNYREPRDAISRDWIRFLELQGAIPILVPNVVEDAGKYVRELQVSGVILTGGGDIDLGDHGESGRDVDAERDHTEHALIEFARGAKLPLLGVCRGSQFINQYFGGALTIGVQTIPGIGRHIASDHLVKLESLEWSGFNKSECLMVNSYHSDGIVREQLARDLIITASSDSGKLVEGFVHRTEMIVGLQWHPERSSPSKDFDRALIDNLLIALNQR